MKMTLLFALVFFGMLSIVAPRHGADSRDGLDHHAG